MGRRLYTEACIRDLAPGSDLVVGPHEIVTPAALDLCFARGIRVRWSAEEPASGASAVESSLWGAILAADGNYMVEVKSGRARVFRLTAAGPTLVGDGV